MLTPAFELFQDDIFLTIVIKAPFTKVSETEIFIEECDFKFYSKPYFLRLNLPGKIVEDGREEANYDADEGTFTIKVPKETPGEVFNGLDMLTKLLAPKGQKSAHQPVIEVLAEESTLPSDALPEEEDIDWSVEQSPYLDSEIPVDGYKYGFCSQRSGVFKRLQAELCEVVDVKDPDSLSPKERQSLRREQENDSFSDDHYLADLYQDEMVQEILKYRPPWSDVWRQFQMGKKRKDIVVLTEEEKEKMRKLPNKEYLIDSRQLPAVYFSLVDIIFAYTYSVRLTEGEHNVESGWTITKLCATLSWLEIFPNLRDVLVTCYRRCLCFPLYRHWSLLEEAKEDTCKILSLGRRQVLKCLLDIQTVLTDTDQRYVLNDLYINEYSVWIQGVSNSKLESLAKAVEKLQISKSDVGLSLVELESAAELAVEEEEAEGIVGKLEKLAVGGNAERDSDDDSTESDDSSDDESTESDDEYSESDDDITKSDDVKTKTWDSDTKTASDVKVNNVDAETRSEDIRNNCQKSSDTDKSICDIGSGCGENKPHKCENSSKKIHAQDIEKRNELDTRKISGRNVEYQTLKSSENVEMPDIRNLKINMTDGERNDNE